MLKTTSTTPPLLSSCSRLGRPSSLPLPLLRACALVPAVLTLASPGALAQISENFSPLSDSQIVNKLHSLDLVEAGRADLVFGRTGLQIVRRFAAQVALDDGNLDALIEELARTEGITLSASSFDDQALAGLKGGPFNRAYMNNTVSENEDALAFLTHAEAQTKDVPLRRLIASFRAMINRHQQMAWKILSSSSFFGSW